MVLSCLEDDLVRTKLRGVGTPTQSRDPARHYSHADRHLDFKRIAANQVPCWPAVVVRSGAAACRFVRAMDLFAPDTESR